MNYLKYEAILEQWKRKATDYPTQALFEAVKEVLKEQDIKHEAMAGQLEGALWSKEELDEEDFIN